MMRFVRGLAAIVGLFTLASCESMITGGPLVRPGEPTATIRIENVSRGAIDVVLISTCSASTYGLNRLPSGTHIPPGRAYQFTVSAGCWDVAVGRIGYGEVRRRFNNIPPGMVQAYAVGD